MNEYGIAAFRSRHQVMKFEEALKKEGLTVRVISTPREIALGCGLSVQFAAKDMRTVQNVMMRAKPENLIGLYLVRVVNGKPQLTVISKRS